MESASLSLTTELRIADAEENRSGFHNSPQVLPSQDPRNITTHMNLPTIGDFDVVSGPIAEMVVFGVPSG
jgi:hypothetical protein